MTQGHIASVTCLPYLSAMRLFLCIPLIAATACIAETEPVPCDPALWTHLIGQSEKAANEVADPKRIIPPNTAVTRDFRFNRTNVDVDDSGVITRIWCG